MMRSLCFIQVVWCKSLVFENELEFEFIPMVDITATLCSNKTAVLLVVMWLLD